MISNKDIYENNKKEGGNSKDNLRVSLIKLHQIE